MVGTVQPNRSRGPGRWPRISQQASPATAREHVTGASNPRQHRATRSSIPASGITWKNGASGRPAVGRARARLAWPVRSPFGDLLVRVDERLAHRHAAVAARGGLDLELLAERLREPHPQHRIADVCLQARRVAGGGHLADLLAAQEHRVHVDHLAVDVGADRRPLDVDADKLAPGALGLDAPESLLADEAGLLVEVDHPGVAHVDLEGVRVVPDVAAERQDAPLDAADVARADHLEPVGAP